MLLKPYSFSPTDGGTDWDFTASPWYATEYVSFNRPVRNTFVELISGDLYDTVGTADAPRQDGVIAFSIRYKQANTDATQDGMIDIEQNYTGIEGTLVLIANATSNAQSMNYLVRSLQPRVRPVFNSQNDLTAIVTLRFQVKSFNGVGLVASP